jgi:predicted N-formylglutamate amidohydrolase
LAATDFILITCEHGGNRIPPAYRAMFSAYRSWLDSHRGYDPGALKLARELAKALDAPLVASTVSRLLVDLNRSVGHPHAFSAATRAIAPELRERIVERYYRPHRSKIERYVERAVAQRRRVIHLACHSYAQARWPVASCGRGAAVRPIPGRGGGVVCAMEEQARDAGAGAQSAS